MVIAVRATILAAFTAPPFKAMALLASTPVALIVPSFTSSWAAITLTFWVVMLPLFMVTFVAACATTLPARASILPLFMVTAPSVAVMLTSPLVALTVPLFMVTLLAACIATFSAAVIVPALTVTSLPAVKVTSPVVAVISPPFTRTLSSVAVKVTLAPLMLVP